MFGNDVKRRIRTCSRRRRQAHWITLLLLNEEFAGCFVIGHSSYVFLNFGQDITLKYCHWRWEKTFDPPDDAARLF